MTTLPVTLGDPYSITHQTTAISTFCVDFCIYQIRCAGWSKQIPAYGGQNVPERGVVTSRDPFWIFSPPKI